MIEPIFTDEDGNIFFDTRRTHEIASMYQNEKEHRKILVKDAEEAKQTAAARKENLIAELRRIEAGQKEWKPGRDIENDHMDADKILLAFIGDEEITAAFNAITKWYS